MRQMLLVAVVVAAASSLSCGYTLAGRGSFLPDTIRTIGVPDFTNRTQYYEVSQVLSRAVRSELIGRGKYRVLPQDADVDAVIRAEITSIGLNPTSFNSDQQATRYSISVSVAIQLVDLNDNSKVLWQNPNQTFREEYALTSGTADALDPAAFFGQSGNAVDRMAADFARSVVAAILEAF